ncbi:CLUMA_CG016820, isoform A [Clunio marinus]|uniref:CLUMA_CG016820, isoform A n=1 Tax=Clunio marinus TaxID=568069 RepID=A0A1J1ITF3_9DIPT|nr:CLUMA_CG016820, isoform A [Clunio marinus]
MVEEIFTRIILFFDVLTKPKTSFECLLCLKPYKIFMLIKSNVQVLMFFFMICLIFHIEKSQQPLENCNLSGSKIMYFRQNVEDNSKAFRPGHKTFFQLIEGGKGKCQFEKSAEHKSFSLLILRQLSVVKWRNKKQITAKVKLQIPTHMSESYKWFQGMLKFILSVRVYMTLLKFKDKYEYFPDASLNICHACRSILASIETIIQFCLVFMNTQKHRNFFFPFLPSPLTWLPLMMSAKE